jgi:hypothetical protein
MENQISDLQDEELEEATKGLEPHDGSVEEGKLEDIEDHVWFEDRWMVASLYDE